MNEKVFKVRVGGGEVHCGALQFLTGNEPTARNLTGIKGRDVGGGGDDWDSEKVRVRGHRRLAA